MLEKWEKGGGGEGKGTGDIHVVDHFSNGIIFSLVAGKVIIIIRSTVGVTDDSHSVTIKPYLSP